MAKALRLLDVLGDLDQDPVAREEDVLALVLKQSSEASKKTEVIKLPTTTTTAAAPVVDRRPAVEPSSGGGGGLTKRPTTTTTVSSGGAGSQRRPSSDAAAPVAAPSGARRMIRPPMAEDMDDVEPAQWAAEPIKPSMLPAYPASSSLRSSSSSSITSSPGVVQPPPYSVAATPSGKWADQQPPSYSSVSSDAGSGLGSPADAKDGVHVLTPVRQDADQNDFVAPCGGCGNLLPLPDGE